MSMWEICSSKTQRVITRHQTSVLGFALWSSYSSISIRCRNWNAVMIIKSLQNCYDFFFLNFQYLNRKVSQKDFVALVAFILQNSDRKCLGIEPLKTPVLVDGAHGCIGISLFDCYSFKVPWHHIYCCKSACYGQTELSLSRETCFSWMFSVPSEVSLTKYSSFISV